MCVEQASWSLCSLRKVQPCIFQRKVREFSGEGSLNVVVEGCGQVGRGPRGGQRAALSTASWPLRAQLELSTYPQPRAATFSRSVRQT